MGIIADRLDIDFVVSTGDNFYDDGLTGVDDPAFDESFKYIYAAPSLQKQWYTGMYIHRSPYFLENLMIYYRNKVTCFYQFLE